MIRVHPESEPDSVSLVRKVSDLWALACVCAGVALSVLVAASVVFGFYDDGHNHDGTEGW